MNFVASHQIRSEFSALMSQMYREEVPLYGDLLDLVADVNNITLIKNQRLHDQLKKTGEYDRLDLERHGAIRLGTAEELNTMRRVFAVMGMEPVGYYDLVPAGVPVHSTAFRVITSSELNESPFRVFTSLLRLELIQDEALRALAEDVLRQRQIFTQGALELTTKFEQQGGLDESDAKRFVQEVLETFRWHKEAPVTQELYQKLHDQHRLIADVVAFKGPHINHLTPRTLDIDMIQEGMASRGITPKAVVEGPPRRRCPILLRQTSFKALDEEVYFQNDVKGSHTARFGEIEQRGVALTPKGRRLYDQLLKAAREELGAAPNEQNAKRYMRILEKHFVHFPDSYEELRQQGLAYFHYYAAVDKCIDVEVSESNVDQLIALGAIYIEPIVYEDFLPVSAAGIFQSNLGDGNQANYAVYSNQDLFEKCLGQRVWNELELYAQTQQNSLRKALTQLQSTSSVQN
ncbi:VOC family protein [Acinetobacter baumannii]|uniref:2-oxoadipate dioxygenase/decarboxylase HglS n=1 Tax=Acinetobacter baumannii TaxID=470 RepID=UPI001BFEBD66|nr:VOC family protein [Acinetobacter baumannii]MBT8176367.1 VOC family protein [Acinetobacter baumannii]MDN8221432.1 VOC family protein [Acinetobacter baumannii]MDN8361320.1 VOC family protein [Acinetobacter baumannii]MDR9620108.1 VOC family protein [Acinetobacter baumannii]HCQ9570461.1 VOC family protein [Acinetobacter baumannii]